MVSLAKKWFAARFSKLHHLLPRTFWKRVICSHKTVGHWSYLPSPNCTLSYWVREVQAGLSQCSCQHSHGPSKNWEGEQHLIALSPWIEMLQSIEEAFPNGNCHGWSNSQPADPRISTEKKPRRSSREFSSISIKLILEFH